MHTACDASSGEACINANKEGSTSWATKQSAVMKLYLK